MMKKFFLIFGSLVLTASLSYCLYQNYSNENHLRDEAINECITCNENGCQGEYNGPEFNKDGDIAHQFSNKMAQATGDELKKQFKDKNFVKVDFKNIEATTEGMGSGRVKYILHLPFEKVDNPCDARTSIEHSGGWGHTPALENRKIALSKLLLPGDRLDVSPMIQTKEGLKEYWIQWRNQGLQKNCSAK